MTFLNCFMYTYTVYSVFVVNIKLPPFVSVGVSHFGKDIIPVDGSKPKIYRSIPTITDIKINGTNTIIHDMIDIPDWHNAFNIKVIIIITRNLTSAVLYNLLNVSITIWVKENAT